MKNSDGLITRRQLIKRFGFAAFLLHPLLRSMAMAASTPYSSAPRFVMVFKGASFQPSQMPGSLANMAGTPIAALQPHASDLILFKNMHIHGGSPKASYQEEHGAGLFGCVTGHQLKYTKNDSYYAYTDYESIDIRIARDYKARTDLASLPFSSLHLGAGAHSDADSVGLGQRYISFRNRLTGDGTYGNAIAPVQSAGQVYDSLMGRINLICASSSTQPSADVEKMRIALQQKKSVLDLKMKDIMDAKAKLGLDTEHSRKLDGLLEGWREAEKLVSAQLANLSSSTSTSTGRACPTTSRPTGDGTGKQNLDQLSPVADQMIGMIQLAFQWDLTRVVAFTLSGASCGQFSPNRGVNSAHHSLEHAGNLASLAKVDAYYAEKFAGLLTALKGVDDGGGVTGLHNSSVVFGMECWSDGDHSLRNIPFMLAGRGGGMFSTGRVVDAAGRSNNDLLLSCLRASGIQDTTFGLASLCKGPIV
jgi:hypothetical protein